MSRMEKMGKSWRVSSYRKVREAEQEVNNIKNNIASRLYVMITNKKIYRYLNKRDGYEISSACRFTGKG